MLHGGDHAVDRECRCRSRECDGGEAVAAALGYRRNTFASSLRRGQGATVGVLVPRLSDTVMALMFEAIGRAAERRGDFDLKESLEHGGYQHFCVHVDNVGDAITELRRRGDVIGEPFEIADISRRLAFIRDPWGNMIELAQTLPGAGA